MYATADVYIFGELDCKRFKTDLSDILGTSIPCHWPGLKSHVAIRIGYCKFTLSSIEYFITYFSIYTHLLTCATRTLYVFLETGPGNLPEVQFWKLKTVSFNSRPIQYPDLWLHGVSNLDPYLSTHGICQVWLHHSVTISCSAFLVSLCVVTLK